MRRVRHDRDVRDAHHGGCVFHARFEPLFGLFHPIFGSLKNNLIVDACNNFDLWVIG